MKALLLFLFAFGFQITTGNVSIVQTCPETKTAWDHRSSIFACEDGNMKYHCVMTSIWNLVEVCITPMNITENEKGCPWVYVLESAAIWVSSFTPCPVKNKECPQDGHGGYSTEQLYKYPPCFRNISERTSVKSDLAQTTIGTRASTSNSVHGEACKSDTEYLPYSTVAMFLLFASIHVFITLLYWKIRKVEDMIQEGNKRTSNTSLGMIQEGNRRTSFISSSSSKSSFDFKESGYIPLDFSMTRRPKNPYVIVPRKKDTKRNDDPPLSVSDLRNGTRRKLYYGNPAEKDLKGNDDTPWSVTRIRTRGSTNYENCPVEKGLQRSYDTPPSVSDTRTEEHQIRKEQHVFTGTEDSQA